MRDHVLKIVAASVSYTVAALCLTIWLDRLEARSKAKAVKFTDTAE